MCRINPAAELGTEPVLHSFFCAASGPVDLQFSLRPVCANLDQGPLWGQTVFLNEGYAATAFKGEVLHKGISPLHSRFAGTAMHHQCQHCLAWSRVGHNLQRPQLGQVFVCSHCVRSAVSFRPSCEDLGDSAECQPHVCSASSDVMSCRFLHVPTQFLAAMPSRCPGVSGISELPAILSSDYSVRGLCERMCQHCLDWSHVGNNLQWNQGQYGFVCRTCLTLLAFRNHRPSEAAPASEEQYIAEPFPDGSCAQGSADSSSNGPPESSPLDLKLSPATVGGDPGPDPWVDLGVWFADFGGTAGLCLSCGNHPVLGCSGLHEVRTFLYACSKVYRDNPNGELLTVVRDVLQYCPGCLHSWHTRTEHKGGISQADPLLSGPLFFHASPDGPTLDEQGDVVSTLSYVSHFPSGKEALWDVQQDCTSSLTACGVSHEQSVAAMWGGQQASTISRSRRTRRRQNRRLRKAAVFASTTAFLDSLIEPLPFEQGAPKAPAEEVLTESCAIDQEVVGRWPGGLGGPDVLQSAAAYFVPCDFGSTAFDPVDVTSLSPGLCQQVKDDLCQHCKGMLYWVSNRRFSLRTPVPYWRQLR